MPNDASCGVRELQGIGWQVLLADPSQWRTCRSELDAQFIANGLRLAAAVNRGEQNGAETAEELDEAAATLFRNVGDCPAGRTMKGTADRARGAVH